MVTSSVFSKGKGVELRSTLENEVWKGVQATKGAIVDRSLHGL